MYNRFLTYLDRGTNGLSVSSIWNALKLTRQHYSCRRALKQKYRLNSYYYPYHLYQQRLDNIEQSKTLANIYKNKYFPTQSLFKDTTEVEYAEIDRHELLRESIQPRTSAVDNLKKAFNESIVEGPLNVKISGTLINLWRRVKYGDWMTGTSQWIVEYVNLYHKALQAMIEGHREVTKDHKTVLEDGKTVEEKLKNVIAM